MQHVISIFSSSSSSSPHCVCLVVRLNTAPRWVQAQSELPIRLFSPPGRRFHEWAGNNHGWLASHLSAEIYKRKRSRTPVRPSTGPDGNAWGLKSEESLHLLLVALSPPHMLSRWRNNRLNEAQLLQLFGEKKPIWKLRLIAAAHCLDDAC